MLSKSRGLVYFLIFCLMLQSGASRVTKLSAVSLRPVITTRFARIQYLRNFLCGKKERRLSRRLSFVYSVFCRYQ